MAAQVVQVLIEVGHRAWYRKKATPDRTHDWILFVRGSDGHDLSHFVEKIVFNLHESFNPSRRVLKSPPYELRESGYGEFMPVIDIYFKNKGEKGAQRKVVIRYYLNLNREDSPPIDNVRPEKLKFYNPAEEFLEKVLKAGGVILGSDGCPLLSKPSRPLPLDPPPPSNAFQTSFESSRNNHDASDFLVDVDSAAKSASQLAKKRKRSTEANPMSNDSNSSNESSVASRRSSSKSDPLDKETDARGTKRKTHAVLFEQTEDDTSKKKRKEAPAQPTAEKSDSNKSRPVEQKQPAKADATEDNKHRSKKDDTRKHSSSHHRRDEDGRHREKSTHDKAHSKQKSSDRNSRSSSRTPSKVKSSELLPSGSRVHGSSSSTHHRSSSSSSSHHHSSSKSSKVEGSRHSGSQSQKGESSVHRSSTSSSKHRTSSSGDNSLSRKRDIQVRLSPVDIQVISDSSNQRSGGSSMRKLETSSGNRIGPSPDGSSSQKPNHSSPMKKRQRNTTLASPIGGYQPPTFDPSGGKSYEDPFSSANRIRPKYDKLLDDMKSDDEEEDGEIRSPVATEPPELAPWKTASSAGSDRKDEKSKESSLDRKKSSSRTTSSSATPRLEKPERFPLGNAEKPSPTKAKSDWNSSSEKTTTSPEDVSFSASQVKVKKSHAKENVESDSRLSKKPSISSKSGSASQKDFSSSSQRTSSSKHTTKGLPPPSNVSLPVDEKDERDFFKVEPQWDQSFASIKTNDAALKKGIESYKAKNEATLYDDNDEKKSETKSERLKGVAFSDRAPNGELLMSLVEMKEKINRVTSSALLNRIVDVIQAAGKLKSDDEALEFDFCQLDPETMQSVKRILETESD